MNLSTAADVAATFLLLGLFVIHAVVAVVLFSLWRLLRMAERSLTPAMDAASGQLDELRVRLQVLTQAAVAPQVDVLAAWAGVRAGVAALVRRP